MSTFETILTRAMNEPEFADLLFTDSERALAEYKLPTETIEKFKDISMSEFKAMTLEERKSFGLGIFKIDASPR